MTSSNVLVPTNKSIYQRLPQLLNRTRRDVFISPRVKQSTEVATVGKLLSSISPVPGHSMLLGECNDGLPFLIQLADPAMGAILIGGDPGCGKTHQLQVMVDSAIRLNPPHDLQISILTHNPNEWRSFWHQKRQEQYLYQLKPWYDPGSEDLIEGLLHLAEARREGEPQGASILFILDDFNFVEDLSYAAQVNLHWLLAYGAQSGIWIAAGIKASYAPKFRYWIDNFRTRIIGAAVNTEESEILLARSDFSAEGQKPGFFNIWTGSHWLNYHLPLLGD